jgi:hypothetical protein
MHGLGSDLILFIFLLFSIQSYRQYQGDHSNSVSSAITCLEDMEESPDSNYHVLRRYIKDRPHISTVSTKISCFKTYFHSAFLKWLHLYMGSKDTYTFLSFTCCNELLFNSIFSLFYTELSSLSRRLFNFWKYG